MMSTCYDCSYANDESVSVDGHPFKLGCKDPFNGSQIETVTCCGQCVVSAFSFIGSSVDN